MQAPLTVTTNVTQEELRIFIKKSLLKQFKYLKYFFYIAVPLSLLNTYSMIQTIAPWAAFLPLIIFPLIFFVAWQLITRLGAKNTYQQKKSDFEHSTYTFSEEALSLKSATLEAKLNWDAFKKVEIDKDFLWLFIAQNQAYILPIRCFENKETLDAVYQLAKNKIT